MTNEAIPPLHKSNLLPIFNPMQRPLGVIVLLILGVLGW